jgi:molybdopterin converting factor small subunit
MAKLLFFAQARELAGVSEAELPLDAGNTGAAILNAIIEKWPQ